MTTVILTYDPGEIFEARVGDEIRFDIGLPGRCTWHCEYPSGEWRPIPGMPDAESHDWPGFRPFRFAEGSPVALVNECALECLEPGRYAMSIRFLADHPGNSSDGFNFSIYLEVKP